MLTIEDYVLIDDLNDIAAQIIGFSISVGQRGFPKEEVKALQNLGERLLNLAEGIKDK